jgi:GTP-binding protein
MEARLVQSCPDLKSRPGVDLPEFVFLGRSNCGKSSLINFVLRTRNLARTSSQPGKTRLLNYYLVDERYYLVDLPGYGFAKVSREQRARWWDLFRALLAETVRPLAVVHLMDVRHRPTDQDREVAGWIRDSRHACAVAVTKIDKVGTPTLVARYGQIITDLALPADTPFIPTSAVKGIGRNELLGWMDAALAGARGNV